MVRKGIVLAGGSGTRLFPVTEVTSKQLMPIFDKPMIYYPLSTLFLAGIRDIAIITTPEHERSFRSLLGDGSRFGVSFEYIVQQSPDGLAQAFILAEKFLRGCPAAMVLGDNIFFGHTLTDRLISANNSHEFATVFCSQVSDPERFGVVEFDGDMMVKSIEEKPKHPKSNFAATGLYFVREDVAELAQQIKPSSRGELEITDLLSIYQQQERLAVQVLKRGFAWFDTGTHESLLKAANFVETVQSQQGLMVACLEEIAFIQNWISESELLVAANRYSKSRYGEYLRALME